VQGTLRQGGADTPATNENVLAALAGTDFFWLDLTDIPGDGSVSELLSVHFGFHTLAVQSAERFNQRPRVDDYGSFMYLVARGADPTRRGNAEVHCFWTDRYVVTVHRGECSPLMAQVREGLDTHPASGKAPPQIVIVYRVVSALADTFFPFDMKRTLMDARKVIAPQRDMMAGIASGVTDVPGMTDEASRYFRDLYDHMIRLADMVDSYRDLLTSVMDTHLSTVSNRLNVVMKQLTIIATIFLPLSFLTGFFGQNFAVMVRFIAAPWTFWVLAVGLELAAVVSLVALFYKRGWLGGPTV
jgi:magnesium transporter